MSTQKNEQYHILSPEWLKMNPLPEDGEFENNDGKWLVSSRRGHVTPGWNEYPYRTRRTDLPPEAYITPPTDTTGAFPSKEWFEARVDAEADHEVTAGSPDTTGSWREGETPETDAQTFIAGHQDWEGECVTADFARQLERQRDAALAQVEALRRDKERFSRALERIGFFFAGTEHQRIADATIYVFRGMTIDEALRRAAIDSAQRQEKL